VGVEVADGDDARAVELQDAGHVVHAEMRPTPMAPTLMRLLGANWPRTEEGDHRESGGCRCAEAGLQEITARDFFLALVLLHRPLRLSFELHDFRVFLRFDDQLCGEQTLFLVLRDVRAVDDVGDELRAEGQRHVVAVDVASLFLIDDEEIVALLADSDVVYLRISI